MKSSSISSGEKRNPELFPHDMITPDITEKDKGLITAFEEIVGKYGEKTALIYNGETMTYEQVNKKVNQLAHYLIEQFKAEGGKVPVIGVYMERSLDSVISMLAIFKAGFIYLPLPLLSDKISKKRLKDYINRCSNSEHNVTAILSHDSGSAEIEFAPGVTPIFLNRDETKDKIKKQRDDNLPLAFDPKKAAFIIFSSGSTGKPKGIRTPHADLLNCILAAIGEPYNVQETGLNVKPGDRVPHLISIGFDASIMEIMLALLTGAELHIMPRSMEHRASDFLHDEKITVGIFTASQMKYMSRKSVESLRAAIVTAEGIPQEVVNSWTEANDFTFIAGYGVSEVTIGSTLGVCDRGQEVHAGKPMHRDIKIYICNENRLPDEPAIQKNRGEVGEIYIVSPGLGHYLISPDAPKEEQDLEKRFCEIEVDGKVEKGYQTRDKGRINAEGQLIVTGRLDRQLQIYGQTICPEEIEHALEYSNIPEVKHIAVDTTTIISSGIVVLYACVFMSEEIDDKSRGDLARRFNEQLLKKGLSRIYIPVRWIFEVLNSDIKLTANGKLDRSAIPGADRLKSFFEKNEHYLSHGLPQISPRYIYEEKVAAIFQEVFGVQCELDVKEDFYRLGGTSLQWIFLIDRLNKKFFSCEKKISPAGMQSSTIESIARKISELKSNAHIKEYDPDLGKKNEVPLFLVHSLLGDADQDYVELIDQLRQEKKDIGAIYTISAPGLECPEKMDASIESLAEYYLKAIEKRYREKHEGQPLIVLGWSAGGVIANEIVKKLQEKGKKAVGIAVDSASPSLLQNMPVEHFIEKYLIRLVGYETKGFRGPNRSSKMENEEWKKGELIEHENSKSLSSLYLPARTPALESEIKRIIVEIKEGINSKYELRTATVSKFFERLINVIKELKGLKSDAIKANQKIIKKLETMCSILKSLLSAEDNLVENCLLLVCSKSAAELGDCLGWEEDESLAIHRIENANHFSVMKRDGQLEEILGLLTQFVYRSKVEKLANVLRQYYETKAEDNINFFHEGFQKASLKENYVVPRLKVSPKNECSHEEKDGSAATIFFPEDLLIPMERKEGERYFTLIEGAGGIGKSTLCQYLAMKWAEKIVINKRTKYDPDKQFSLLVWLSLKDVESYMKLAKGRFSIGAHLYYRCGLKENFKKKVLKVADIDKILEQAQAETLYILDAGDEIADAINDAVPHHEFKNFLEKLLATPHIVMTSRPYFSAMLSRVTHRKKRDLELLGFGPAEVMGYIEKYFAKKTNDPLAKEKTNSLLDYIKHHSDLKNLLYTPMFLQLLCSLWGEIYLKHSIEVEITKSDLYNRFIDFSLNNISLNEGVPARTIGKDTQERRKYLTRRVLGQLAFYRLKNINFQITEQNIVSICTVVSEDACDILLENVLKSGFFNRIDTTYEFIHLGLQEFYAAFNVVEEFVQARGKNSSFKVADLLGDEKNRYSEKYEEVWKFALLLLIERQSELATDFFELINAGTVSYSGEWLSQSLKNVPNQFIIKPDGMGSDLMTACKCVYFFAKEALFTPHESIVVISPKVEAWTNSGNRFRLPPKVKDEDKDLASSFNRKIHLPGKSHALKAVTLLLSLFEQALQTERVSQKKSISFGNKEGYLTIARKLVFDIVYNYPLIFAAHSFKINNLRIKFIRTIALCPHLLKENLLGQIPQTVTISDPFFKAAVLTFYCELHQLGTSFSDDISNKINKEIFDNFESIHWMCWQDWFITPVNFLQARGSIHSNISSGHEVRFDAEKLLSHDIIDKLISYYILDDKTLRKIFSSAQESLPALAKAPPILKRPVPAIFHSKELGTALPNFWAEESLILLLKQYHIAPNHLLTLIDNYSTQHNDIQSEKLEELKNTIIENSGKLCEHPFRKRIPKNKAYHLSENASAGLPDPEGKTSQHSFWCCRDLSEMDPAVRGYQAPALFSKDTSDAPESNLTSEPCPQIKEADPRGQSIVNQKSTQNIPSQSKLTFFNGSPSKRESIQSHAQPQESIGKEIFTKGGGDCAFHAVLGVAHDGIIECSDIVAAREALHNAIKDPSKIDVTVRADFEKKTIEGIQNWIMSGNGNLEPRSDSSKLGKDYRTFEEEQARQAPEVWNKFETEIKRHPEILEYIERNNSSNASFRDKFYSALSDQNGDKEDELYCLILSLPQLQESFDEYNRKTGEEYKWEEKISAYPQVREEFAVFVGTPRVWLAATELLLIAYAFERTVHYFPYPGAESIEFNPGYSTPVLVQFDGQGHFERIQQDIATTPTIASSLSFSQ